jgi:hypothetical protein
MAGVLVACVAYRILFYDFGDFMRGCGKFLSRGRRWRGMSPPDDFEDEGWSNGIRFFLFLGLSAGGGYAAYCGLHKIFG